MSSVNDNASKRSKSASAQSSSDDTSVSEQVSGDAALAALFTTVRRPATRRATAAPSPAAPAAPAAAAASSSPAPTPPRSSRAKRKHVAVAYDHAASEPPAAAAAAAAPSSSASASAETDMPALEAEGETAELKNDSSSGSGGSGGKNSKSPAEWKRVYLGIEEMRFRGIAKDAPVDTVGCERLAAPGADDRTRRWHTLVSLMLSSQTKDPVTAQAMANLHAHWPDGLTVDNVMHCDDHTLDSLINKVGFHNRKTIYLKKTAAICHAQYNGDIPATLEELVALPGVGPKMAHLTLQVAWRNVVGIGVDTHVHRISNRLGWAKSNTPEQTRVQLEQWLPREYWGVVNVLLVGFGQKVCLPIGPRCSDCRVNALCPTGRANLRYDKRPDKFFPLPPLKSAKQLQQEDEAVAQRELGLAAATGRGGDGSSGSGSGGVKMEDEPQRLDDAAAASPPSSSSAAAAAAASSAPAVKSETPAPVKQERTVSESKQTEAATSTVQSEQSASGGGSVESQSRSRSSFMRQA